MKQFKKVLLVALVFGIATLSTVQTALALPGPGDWSMYGEDASGSRYNADEKKLGKSNVANLAVLWQLPTATIVTGTPVVTDNMVFAAETGNFAGGTVYALNANTGAVVWQTTLPGSNLTAS